MTKSNLKKLSIAVVLPMMHAVLGMGCDSSHAGLKTAKDAGDIGSSGGITTSEGGRTGTGGRTGAGGATITGITTTAGGLGDGSTTSANTGGSSNLGGDSGTGGTTLATPPTIDDSGYVTVSAGTVVLVGFISSATAGSGSSIALTYGPSDFCASGTVSANTTYKSWANAGFTVNQNQSGASGSANSLVFSGSTISISYVNHAGSELEFQLYDGSNYWCYILPPSTTPNTTTIPFSSLNTQCWNGLGSPFTSGTAITTVSLVVPGSNAVPTPFDFCFLGLSVN